TSGRTQGACSSADAIDTDDFLGSDATTNKTDRSPLLGNLPSAKRISPAFEILSIPVSDRPSSPILITCCALFPPSNFRTSCFPIYSPSTPHRSEANRRKIGKPSHLILCN